MPGTNVGAPIQACPFAKQNKSATSAKKQETKHSVDLTLISDKGELMAGVKVHLIFSDESSMEVTSNEKGEIKIADVPPGQVRVVSDWHQAQVENIVLLV